MLSGIYKIVNTKNQKFYLGSSKNIEKRWWRHKSDLRTGKHHNTHLQRAWNKYGEQHFVIEVIELTEKLLEREQYYLDNLLPEYNIGLNACGGDNLTNHPRRTEIIEKITAGVIVAKSAVSDEQRESIKQKLRGEGNPNYGKRWNQSQRKRASLARKGIKLSDHTKTKMSQVVKERWQDEIFHKKECERLTGSGNPFFGLHHNENTKQKLRDHRKQRYENASFEELQKLNPNLKKVEIDGIIYDGLKPASTALGTCRATILNRIRSQNPKFAGYKYVD
jgi:group I intron endonuclease